MANLKKTTLKKAFKAALAKASSAYPSRPGPLAQPPAGSGLQPVMGEPGPPVLGSALEMINDPLKVTMERYRKYGGVTWGRSIGMNLVTLVGPAEVEAAWMNKEKAFSSEQGWEPMIGPFFRRGIMLMDFEEHMYHRRIMQQAFTPARLRGYLGIMTPHIEKALSNWDAGSNGDARIGFPVYSRVKDLALTLATEVFMGAAVTEQEAHRLESSFEAAVRGGQALIRSDIKIGTWARGLRGREALQEYFRAEIAARRAGTGDDLFTVLCHTESDQGETFTDEDVVNHMIFVMMAAHDTSTIALSMLVYHLGRNPQWQERLRAESLALGKAAIDYEDIDKLPGLELALKETLRINAPVGMLFRKTVRDTDILGKFIPEGTLVAINPWATMLLDEWWPNPSAWDPERFSPERREDKVHRFAWAPFGGGAHKCIGLYFAGMEIKAIMHQMLLQFEWSVPDDYRLNLTYGTGPTPADGLPVDFTRR